MSLNRSSEPKPAKDISHVQSDPVLMPAITRLGVPVGIFGITFLLIAISLTFLFSPDRYPVRVGDKTVRLHELEAEEKSLTIKRAELMEQRQKILAETHAPVLDQVAKLRSQISPLGSAMVSIEDVRRSFRTSTNDPISLPGVIFDASVTTLTLTGQVSDAGGRSIQLLASFVDELRQIPFFASVSEPEYVSEPFGDGGTISRFTLTLRFTHE